MPVYPDHAPRYGTCMVRVAYFDATATVHWAVKT